MSSATIATGKQERKTFALLFTPDDTTSELIGEGIEEIAIEQGASVEKKKDVTGSTRVILDSYEKTTSLDPIYVAGGFKFSERLDDIEENDLTGSRVEDDFVWVKLYKKISETEYTAWKQKAVIELTSFGGDTKGVGCPCTLHWTGERIHGTYNPTTKKFTASVQADG